MIKQTVGLSFRLENLGDVKMATQRFILYMI